MIPKDLKHFARMTTCTQQTVSYDEFIKQSCLFNSSLSQNIDQGQKELGHNAVIMGRKTWESIPIDKRPLANRLNVVLSTNPDIQLQYESKTQTIKPLVFQSLEQALTSLSCDPLVKETFVIGGQSLYEEAVSEPLRDLCKTIIVTRINKEFEADVKMPPFEDNFTPLYISQTYSQPQDDLTFDYCFYGNKSLLGVQPQLVPTQLFKMYPKH